MLLCTYLPMLRYVQPKFNPCSCACPARTCQNQPAAAVFATNSQAALMAKLKAQREAKAHAPDVMVLYGSATGTAQMVRRSRRCRGETAHLRSLAVANCPSLEIT